MTFDKAGNLYGTTTYSASDGSDTAGAVYEISAAGVETILHHFSKNGTEGYHPYGGVTLVGKALYGTTLYGGTNDSGALFKVVP